MQKKLRLLKQQIKAAIASTKSEFTTARVSVGKSFGAGFAAGLFGRKTMGSINATRRDDLRRAQIRAVAPYENVKGIIDQIINKLDSIKGQIELSPEYQTRPEKPIKAAPIRPPPLPATSRRYYVYLNSEIKGPYLREQLKALYDTGTIATDTQCCLEGAEEWTPYLDL